MEISLVQLVLVGIIFLAIPLGIWKLLNIRRGKKLSDLAREMGFSYMSQDQTLLDNTFADHHFFARRKKGCFKKCHNVLRGEYEGHSTILFDYHWKGNPNRQSDALNLETVLAIKIDKSVDLNKNSRGWYIEGKNGWVVLCKTREIVDERIPPKKVKEYLNEGFHLATKDR